MLIHLATLFPCMVGAVWSIIFLLKFGKGKQHWYFAALALLGAVYLFADACTINNSSSYRTLAFAYIINLFVAPSLSLFCWAYLRAIRTANEKHSGAGYLIAIPTIIVTVGIICLGAIGINKAEGFIVAYEKSNSFPEGFIDPIYQIFKVVCIDGFNIILGAAVAAIFIYIIVDLVRSKFTFKKFAGFLFKKGNERVLHLQDLSFILFLISFTLRGVLGRRYFISHEHFTMLFYFITGLFCLLICFIASYAEYYELALSDFFIPRDTIDKEKVKLIVSESEKTMQDESIMPEDEIDDDFDSDDIMEEESEEESDEEETVDYSNISVSDALVKRFNIAMNDEKMYLISGLTIKDICEKIGSNKTYVSKIVNEAYHMPFPNYVNYLRVEYAKKYILDHPDAKQDEIAEESGFPNAAAFNRSFKKATGTTPRIWLAQQ